MGLQILYKCYPCGTYNRVEINPITSVDNDKTLILYYSDTIQVTCPHCGEKYSIPNQEPTRVILKGA